MLSNRSLKRRISVGKSNVLNAKIERTLMDVTDFETKLPRVIERDVRLR